MTNKVVQHRHCLNCGKAIPPTEEYCSDECREERIALLRRKRRQLIYLYIGGVLILILAILLSFGWGV